MENITTVFKISAPITLAIFIICRSLMNWDKVKLKYYLMFPKKITAKVIYNLDNGNDALLLYNKIGHKKYITTFNKSRQFLYHDRDSVGEIFIYTINRFHPWVHVVKVKNSTPEPDGSYKDYYIRVSDDHWHAQSGVAWTFGLRSDQYNPEIET